MGGGPEDKEGDGERDGQESGQLVCRGIMRALTGGLSSRVFNQGRDILRDASQRKYITIEKKEGGGKEDEEGEGGASPTIFAFRRYCRLTPQPQKPIDNEC